MIILEKRQKGPVYERSSETRPLVKTFVDVTVGHISVETVWN